MPHNQPAEVDPGSIREHVRDMVRAGVPVRRIALALDISTQYVYRLRRELQDAGELKTTSGPLGDRR